MKKVILFLLLLAIVLALFLRVRYGGGDDYPDLTGKPLLATTQIEQVLTYREPIGNVAVSGDGRVFFTVHPEARPQGNKLLEYVDGASVPWPSVGSQEDLFYTVLGIVIDQQNRLWTIDHGNHGMHPPRLLAFDLETGEVMHDRRFSEQLAPRGSFLQDLQVSADGRTVIIADASIWRKQPALIVYNTETSTARRVLEGHESVSAEKYIVHNHGEPMTYAGGLVALRAGVDGIALNDEWLYFGALTGAGLYRIAVPTLVDPQSSDEDLAAAVERFSDKPLSDGFSMDSAGNVYVTDIEHGAVVLVGSDRKLQTLLRSAEIRWADALSFGPNGWLYVADSALKDVVLQSREHIDASGPYKIFRVQVSTEGIPSQ
jgi:sugar lactone lactonase YvrE